jgi:hypothetical protein
MGLTSQAGGMGQKITKYGFFYACQKAVPFFKGLSKSGKRHW